MFSLSVCFKPVLSIPLLVILWACNVFSKLVWVQSINTDIAWLWCSNWTFKYSPFWFQNRACSTLCLMLYMRIEGRYSVFCGRYQLIFLVKSACLFASSPNIEPPTLHKLRACIVALRLALIHSSIRIMLTYKALWRKHFWELLYDFSLGNHASRCSTGQSNWPANKALEQTGGLLAIATTLGGHSW